MVTAKATIRISQIRMNFGKFIMQRVILFVMVPLILFLNLAKRGYTKGYEKTTGKSGMKDTMIYHSGSLTPLIPKNAK